MAIYDFSTKTHEELHVLDDGAEKSHPISSSPPKKCSLFSALASRLLFFLLLLADLAWMVYTLVSVLVFLGIIVCTGGRWRRIRGWLEKKWIALRRSLVCAVALMVALFSPSFGMMVACTYFLMYDKAGIQEVVPSALQSEFTDLASKSGS